ncbi:MAG: ATP-binding protein [Pseudomonadota bacterium]
MKRILESLTLVQLLLIGFLAVIAPLVVAILIAVVQSDELAVSSRQALVSVQTSTDVSRQLAEQVSELERSARQYAALDDQEILKLYRQHRSEAAELLAVLREVSGNAQTRDALETFAQAESELHSQIEALKAPIEVVANVDYPVGSAAGIEPSDDLSLDAPALRLEPPVVSSPVGGTVLINDSELEHAYSQLQGKANNLLTLYSQRGRELARQLPKQAVNLQTYLLSLAAMVIPLSLALALLFIALARRPLRELDAGIRSLGQGSLTGEIRVHGTRDLADLGGTLNWLRKRLRALEEQKTLFLREVSHELKTPLTNIREASELLLDGPNELDDSESATVTRILHDNSLRLQTLIEELLRFGAAAGPYDKKLAAPIELHRLVDEVADVQTIAGLARGVSIDRDLDSMVVYGDPRKIGIIISNLLSNAIKFSPTDARVVIRVRRVDECAQLDVIDEGPGIPPENRDAVFDWFFTGAKNAGQKVRGSGLGLAIAYEYVGQHDGDLCLIETERGAHFRLTLPASQGSQ